MAGSEETWWHDGVYIVTAVGRSKMEDNGFAKTTSCSASSHCGIKAAKNKTFFMHMHMVTAGSSEFPR